MLFSPIHHTFGPHVDARYQRRVLRLSYAPWRYRKGPRRCELEQECFDRYGMHAHCFASGREALSALLMAMNLPKGSEIVVQGYTCIVVPNAIHAAGHVPVYADIDPETLNLNRSTVEAVLTEKTRVVICQHTFGFPAPLEELRTLCDERQLMLIEDCAHILPDDDGPDEMLRWSDAAILSFGRDKAISGICGGAALARDRGVARRTETIKNEADEVPFIDVVRMLEYPMRMRSLVRPWIGLGLHRFFVILQKLLGLFVPVLSVNDRMGKFHFPLRRMPNVCAALALAELGRLSEINNHRRSLARFYAEESRKRGWPMLQSLREMGVDGAPVFPLQKFPLFTKKAETIRRTLRSKNIHLNDDWTGCVICPSSVDPTVAGYERGSDPCAEERCLGILSLPTHPTMTLEQAKYLVNCLDPLL